MNNNGETIHKNYIIASNIIFATASLYFVKILFTIGITGNGASNNIRNYIIIILIIGGLAYLVRKGFPWVKYLLLVLTVLGLQGIPAIIINLQLNPRFGILESLQIILQIAATVLLFRVHDKGIKKRNFLIVLIYVLFLSCNSNPKDKVVYKVDSLQSNTEMNWEVEEKEMKEELEKRRKDFKILKAKKSFEFFCYDKCEDGVGVNPKELMKFGKRKPFDIEKRRGKDTLTIKFKFISDCCLEYIGDVEKVKDSLKLSYKNIGNSPCDCYCYYYYMFELPVNKYNSRFIVLGDSVLGQNF